jgi:hypothetical protein
MKLRKWHEKLYHLYHQECRQISRFASKFELLEKSQKIYLSQKQECIDLSCLETLRVHMPKKWICRPLSVERFFFVEKVLERANLFRLTAELAKQAGIPFQWDQDLPALLSGKRYWKELRLYIKKKERSSTCSLTYLSEFWRLTTLQQLYLSCKSPPFPAEIGS